MSNNEDVSKVIVYENGDIMDLIKVRQLLLSYWKLNEIERRAFQKMFDNADTEQKYAHLLNNDH